MARVNITVPDDLLERARAAGLNVSRVSSDALVGELDRRAKIAALNRYLRELDVELGPISGKELKTAGEWADRLDDAARPTLSRSSRTA
ncbi:MAG: type II toxin-antitoxin system CcdA family antitoxin [Actinomycetota bacterium]|nr:type II toxin-antitoxin system CcdA family antitoxin [Actinomycetota bacterium]